ncbi:unnamed protein product [Prunus armeniaca]
MLHHRLQCQESPFLPFETPEIALLPITLTGNRLSTESPRRKSPQTELSLLTRCKVSAHPGSSLFIREMAGNGTPRKTKRRMARHHYFRHVSFTQWRTDGTRGAEVEALRRLFAHQIDATF